LATSNDHVRLLISSPGACIEYFVENHTYLLRAVLITFTESILGLTIATMFSFILMIICFKYQGFFRFILPIVMTTQVIPLITLAPFFILWLGIGITSKIVLSAVISFYPVFLNFATGYNSISQNIIELLDIYRASLAFKIRHIYFPLSMPNIFTGLKISATLSVIGAIVAEFSGAAEGLGKNLLMASIRIEPELMMLSIFLSSIIGGVLYGLLYFIEKLLGSWYIGTKRMN